MNGVSKSKASILAGIVFSVLILGLSGSQNAYAGGPNLDLETMIMFDSGEMDGGDSAVSFVLGDDATASNEGPFTVPIGIVCDDVVETDAAGFGGILTANIVDPIDLDPNIPGFDSGDMEFDWKPQLDVDDPADPKWLSTASDTPDGLGAEAGDTGLFIHDFFIPFGVPIFRATLVFDYLIDNVLGDLDDPGLLVNCEGLPGSASGIIGSVKGNFQADKQKGPFVITEFVDSGTNTLYIYSHDIGVFAGTPGGVQYKATILLEFCPPGQELEVDFDEESLVCVGGTSGSSGHEPPTIGRSLDGVRQVVDGGISVDAQTWTVTQGYHQEFELLQMLTSPHTISNVIHCAKGVEYCNYIAVGFMGLTDDFNNPVMTVSASKDHLGAWTIDWYDPDNYIADPGDASPKDIVFVPQIIDNKLLGTSFTIDFNNKDTGQLKMGIQVRDSYNGVRNFFFNEGVEFVDADAYPSVEAAYDAPLEVEPVCFGQNNPDRNSCQFAKMQEWATANAEETLRQMMGNQYEYEQ